MGRRLDILLGRTSRSMAKLKALLGLTVSRLAVLRNKRLARCSHARGDVAQLLLLGQQDRALLRAEQVIHEQNMLDAFVVIESYCHLIAERSPLLDRLRECPDELREAVSGLIFAASRCGDLPELHKVRRIVASQFGSEFAAAAVELRNNCGVNPKLIQKMSTRQPSLENKIRVTKEIAAVKGITLDLEEEPTAEQLEIGMALLNKSEKQSQVIINPSPPPSAPKEFSASVNQQYKDAASAAQAAFESAAFAAAAARVAVELSQSESQGKGPGGNPGSGRRGGAENDNYSSESESEEELGEEDNKGITLEKSPSSSSSDSAEAPHFYEKKSSMDNSHTNAEDLNEEQSILHKPSYLRPPYRKGIPVSYGDNHDDSNGGVPRRSINAGQGAVSTRTRRGI